MNATPEPRREAGEPLKKAIVAICPTCEQPVIVVPGVDRSDGKVYMPSELWTRRLRVLMEGRGLPRCATCGVPCEILGAVEDPGPDEQARKTIMQALTEQWRARKRQRGDVYGKATQTPKEATQETPTQS